MKKLLFFILLFIIACCVAMFLLQPDQREPQERFREGMNFEQFSVYTDSIFDYQFEYPSFLRREHVEGYGCGHVQFGFHNGVQGGSRERLCLSPWKLHAAWSVG